MKTNSSSFIYFTSEQAVIAQKKIKNLMLNRRFFLHDHLENGSYPRPCAVFDLLDSIDRRYQESLKTAREFAEVYIQKKEKDLGFAPPDLNEGQRVVKCSRYTGGLDICTAWPLAKFEKYMPDDLTALLDEVVRMIDSGAPSMTRFNNFAVKAWHQMEEMFSSGEQLTVVILKTRFFPDNDHGNKNDLMGGRVTDLQKYSHALGYLLYRASCECHLLSYVSDPWILCSTDSRSHVAVVHHSHSERPRIWFDASHTYPYKVHFATVL